MNTGDVVGDTERDMGADGDYGAGSAARTHAPSLTTLQCLKNVEMVIDVVQTQIILTICVIKNLW